MKKILTLGALLILAACGKAGSPVVPGSGFPHPYPDPKLSPNATAKAPPPEDQPGLQTEAGKAKFSDKGSYIDPAVRATELQRAAITPGSTLPYSQTQNAGSATPFNQGLSNYSQSPLGNSNTDTPPSENEQPPQ